MSQQIIVLPMEIFLPVQQTANSSLPSINWPSAIAPHITQSMRAAIALQEVNDLTQPIIPRSIDGGFDASINLRRCAIVLDS